MATHSSILAWKIPWTEKTGRLSFMTHKELGTAEGLTLSLSFNLYCLEYVILHGKKNFANIIKFIKLKTRRLSPVLKMGSICSTEPVTAKRFLSSWVQRDAVEKKEAVETFRS